MINNVDYHITDKCNLNCVACNHFCPLVPSDTEHKSMEQIEKDLTLLSKFKHLIGKVTILGGEPTLHPNFIEVLYLARKLFPQNIVEVTTNGTTYKKFKEYAKAIIDNDISIIVSVYPFGNVEERNNTIKDALSGHESLFFVEDNLMLTGSLTLTRQNTDDDILKCRMRTWCCQLKDEHLYLCNYAAQIDYLYKEFPFLKNYIFREGYEKVDLNTATDDDIYILTKLNIPALCFYCHECNRKKLNQPNENEKDWFAKYYDKSEYTPWKSSTKRIDEWIR